MLPYLYLLAGSALLYFGAESLVRGSSALARRAGLSALVVGLTVVAFGTSAPELAVSVDAAIKGKTDIALGNVVGSNIANIGLILGIAALLQRLTIRAQLVRIDLIVLIAASIALPLLLLDGQISRIEGVLLTSSLAVYLAYTVVLARRARVLVRAEFDRAVPAQARNVWLETIMIPLGIALLVAGAELLVHGAVGVAQRFHVSNAIIGLTVVALGTSLPELATSVVAALKKEGDLVVGNVIGSNIFNLLCILGISATVAPMRPQAIVFGDQAVMIGLALVLLPLMRSGMRLTRREGLFLLLTYLSYMAYVVIRA
jgi:cation:H+ antiporter